MTIAHLLKQMRKISYNTGDKTFATKDAIYKSPYETSECFRCGKQQESCPKCNGIPKK